MTSPSECIRLTDVSFHWPTNTEAIIDIPSLSVQNGEKLFIYGRSGSGKTTLLNLITGVLSPDEGEISILREQLPEKKSAERDQYRADHFGIIFQQFNLIPYLSVIENIMLPCLFSYRRQCRIVQKHLTVAQESKRLLTSLGLDETNIANRNITELSTGQQQRVAAARALLGTPEIIIADEPTSSLDADAKHGFLTLLFEELQRSNSALVFVSHDRSLATEFDRVLSFDELNQNCNA